MEKAVKGCCCTWGESGANMALCDLHAREFQKRVATMPMAIKHWNDALDAVEAKLVAHNVTGNPIDEWIGHTLAELRRKGT